MTMSDEDDGPELRRFCIGLAAEAIAFEGVEDFMKVVIAASVVETYITYGLDAVMDMDVVQPSKATH